MEIAATSSLAIGAPYTHLHPIDGSSCSTSYAIATTRLNPGETYGSRGFSCASFSRANRDASKWRASVAADYSDSLPDSSYTSYNGYHPLEDVKTSKRFRSPHLSPAEKARTTVEAEKTALVIFPGSVHCEPHEHISWAEFPYVVDDFGDIFLSIPDDKNILQDPGAPNLVNVLIGMDIPNHGNRRVAAQYDVFNVDESEDFVFDEEYYESDADTDPDVHPLHFSKCLSKAINVNPFQKMDHPMNGVSFIGCLRTAFADEELYIKELFGSENDDYEDADVFNSTTLFRLDIVKIELFSIYGTQTTISLQDFQDAEPDVLARFSETIINDFLEYSSLKALCKKKGLFADTATLIGVDSLGIDVRISSGLEVKTHRFAFKSRATSEIAAEKQINQLLFPRSRRKKLSKDAKLF